MKIRITVDDLRRLDACSDGVEDFAALYPSGLDLDWTPETQIEWYRSSPLRDYLGWAFGVNLLPRWSMRGADLRGAVLRDADLRGADLCGADLRGADLRGAVLRGADLRGADLCGAVLRGADLRGAVLRGADLRGADLESAIADECIPGWDIQNGRLTRCTKREEVTMT